MTGTDIIRSFNTEIVELSEIYANMNSEEYRNCKAETLEALDERAKPFMEKVFTLIESVIYGNTEKFSLC